MKFPVLTILFILFIIWLQYEIRKASMQSKKASEQFWEKEKSSNLTRRRDLSELDYIKVELDHLPMQDFEDQTINSYRDTIKNLADQKIVNLTGLTNTELKYRYGASNLNQLSEYDYNYTVLVSILHKWAERLYKHSSKSESRIVLEYAVSIHTDVTKSYQLLATLYKETNELHLIDELIAMIPMTKITNPDQLIAQLQKAKLF